MMINLNIIVADDNYTVVILDQYNGGAKVKTIYTSLGDLIDDFKKSQAEQKASMEKKLYTVSASNRPLGAVNYDAASPTNPSVLADEIPF